MRAKAANYLKTQVAVLTSDKVLEPAVANALVVNLPMVKLSNDPKNEIREKLKIGILENTNLIRVALELPNREDAITIVQAVVQSYLLQNTDIRRTANQNLTVPLDQQLKKLGDQIELKRSALKDLYRRGKAAAFEPREAAKRLY